MKACTVYALASSNDGEPRYVGQTCWPVRMRLRTHLKRAQRGCNGWLWNWIRKTLRSGYEVEIIVLEEDAEWNVSEQTWVYELLRRGCKLLNQTPGGDRVGGYHLTSAAKRRLRVVSLKLWSDPAYREKVLAGHQRYWTAERREQQAARASKQGSSLAQRLVTSARMKMKYADPVERFRQIAHLDAIRSDPKRLDNLRAATRTDAYRKLKSKQTKAIWAARKAVMTCSS